MCKNNKSIFLLACLFVFHYAIIAALASDSDPLDVPSPSIKVTQAISILVEPKEWVIGCAGISSTLNYQKPDINNNTMPENSNLNKIGCVYVNHTYTQDENSKIIVTNNGIGTETLELKLINPPGWGSSTTPGKETYVLSGIFCGPNDIPQKDSFNQDTGYEDIIFTLLKRATSTVFGYSQATANGTKVLSGESRSLYLQFKSPTVTNQTTEQIISVIVSCEPDY